MPSHWDWASTYTFEGDTNIQPITKTNDNTQAYFTRKSQVSWRKPKQLEDKENLSASPSRSQLWKGQLCRVISGRSCAGAPARGAGSGHTHSYQAGTGKSSAESWSHSIKPHISAGLRAQWTYHMFPSAQETGLAPLSRHSPSPTDSQGFPVALHAWNSLWLFSFQWAWNA